MSFNSNICCLPEMSKNLSIIKPLVEKKEEEKDNI